MQTKLKLSALLLTLFFAVTPFTSVTANAMTYDLRLPSFGLYCENENADIHGKVKYVIDERGKAVQYSEYSVNSGTFYVPFISSAFNIPETNITINGQGVKNKLCYGEPLSNFTGKFDLNFYSADIADITGTLYSLTASGDSFTVDFDTLENQSFIYRLTNSLTGKRGNGNYSYTLNNALTGATYEIFVINGDFARFESSAETVKETLTAKEYINRHFIDSETYFPDFDNMEPDVLYAQINRALENNINYDYFDFFFDSYSDLHVNAYKIDLQPHEKTSTIAYSMPVDVRINTAFKPDIYLTEQTATGRYAVDYTVQLNSELPFIIDSNAEIEEQNNYTYTAKNIDSDFYFVFSSDKKPESVYGDDTNNTLIIVLSIILSVALCALIALGISVIQCFKKAKK